MNYDIAQSEANETKAPECQNTHFDSFLEIGVSTVISVIWNRMEQDSMLILFQHWQVSIRIKEAVLLKPFEQKETPAKFDSTDSTDVPWQIWARTRRAPKDPRIQKGSFGILLEHRGILARNPLYLAIPSRFSIIFPGGPSQNYSTTGRQTLQSKRVNIYATIQKEHVPTIHPRLSCQLQRYFACTILYPLSDIPKVKCNARKGCRL